MSANRVDSVQQSSGFTQLLANSEYSTISAPVTVSEWSTVSVLVVGSGGLGCELLPLLALSGFTQLTTIDLDRIELSNLNRQFLFQPESVGKWKSEVAAAAVMARCPGVTVHAVCGRIEHQPDSFYQQFDIIVFALDSVEARRWMNQKVIALAEWEWVEEETEGEENNKKEPIYRIAYAKPMLDLGTEGYGGNYRWMDVSHNENACLECVIEDYQLPRKEIPLCSLESIPRSAEHCVLYVMQKTWSDERGAEALDADLPEHVHWVTERARLRQQQYHIDEETPIDDFFSLGIIKNVVPSVGFTNAFVSSQAVTELIKGLSGVGPTLKNYCMYNGRTGSGVSTTTVWRSADARCPYCSPYPAILLSITATLEDTLKAIAHRLRERITLNTEDCTVWLELAAGEKEVFLSRKQTGAATMVVEEGERQQQRKKEAVKHTTLKDCILAAGVDAKVLQTIVDEEQLVKVSSTEENFRLIAKLSL